MKLAALLATAEQDLLGVKTTIIYQNATVRQIEVNEAEDNSTG
jgi:hypothetical protein